MGNSFKVQKGGSAKEQSRGAGAFSLLLGLIVAWLFHPIGFVIAGLGLIFFIASFAASE